jgi:hypothetical protein
MGLRNYNKDFFKNKESVKSVKEASSQRVINGEVVTANSKSFKVQNAAEILINNNVFPDTYSSLNVTNNTNPDTITALGVLSAIGVTPVYNQERDFSFLKTQDMLTPINPNIVDENRLDNLKNKSIKADDKFKDSSNPFYNLEDSVSVKKKEQIDKLKSSTESINPINTAAAIFDINVVNSSNLKLRQFK